MFDSPESLSVFGERAEPGTCADETVPFASRSLYYADVGNKFRSRVPLYHQSEQLLYLAVQGKKPLNLQTYSTFDCINFILFEHFSVNIAMGPELQLQRFLTSLSVLSSALCSSFIASPESSVLV